MSQQIIGWSAVLAWIAFSSYFIYTSPTSMTLHEILLMMPQWCEMTDLTSHKGYILLSPQTTLWCCFTTLMLLSICWFFTAEEDVEEMSSDVIKVDQDTKANLVQDEITEDVLLENAKSLLDMVDLEYKHCAATIAANNETPGKKVGGETEWATGETSSEDEDATREITGAKIRKSPKEAEDEEIMKFLQGPFEKCSAKEPHIRMLSNENKLKTAINTKD